MTQVRLFFFKAILALMIAGLLMFDYKATVRLKAAKILYDHHE